MHAFNLRLFELINAGDHVGLPMLLATRVVAQWLILLVPVIWLVLWFGADERDRLDLLHVLLSAMLALGIAQLVGFAFPSPRPFALHLGHQYLPHVNDPGLPSDHATLLWSLAFGALGTARASWLVFPFLAVGLVVGWARVYLGVHFPFDIAAALPVAAMGAGLAWAMRSSVRRHARPWVARYDRWQRLLLERLLHTD
jgi:undecaprenyl-diphosphatase